MMQPSPTSKPSLTRRAWLEACFRPLQAAAAGPAEAPVSKAPKGPQLAVIAGRHCLAYQNSFCTTCSERCPVPGAIVIEEGFPRVVADKCTGCEICHQVCPAPEKAILLVPKRGMAAPSRPAA